MIKGIVFGMILLLAAPISGCGVKGDPQPPLQPVQMGRGQPTFKDAVKEIQPEKIKKEDEDGK